MNFASLCVFCGSSSGLRPEYREAAEAVGKFLAEQGIRLVYGGGKVGLMGIVADAALAGGGEVIGVIPRHLADLEVGHNGLTELRLVGSMHERKAIMAELSDGFIALPGGYGTFEEFCEVLTWSQLGLHPNPCGLLNVLGYYDPLLALFNRGVSEGFIRTQHREIVIADSSIESLTSRMELFRPSNDPKWVIVP